MRNVKVAENRKPQLLSREVQKRSGLTLRANSIFDGTSRFLALVALSEESFGNAVICIEEPANSVHRAKLDTMNRLLHDIAVDVEGKVDFDNPLRQVIVATHSPYFVQLQNPDDLTLAKNPGVGSASGNAISPLKCYPLTDSWRSRATNPTGKQQGIRLLDLQAHLMSPEAGQLAFPRESWKPHGDNVPIDL